jgi:hypothetical protein
MLTHHLYLNKTKLAISAKTGLRSKDAKINKLKKRDIWFNAICLPCPKITEILYASARSTAVPFYADAWEYRADKACVYFGITANC